MATFKERIAEELKSGKPKTISENFIQNELDNAEILFKSKGDRKRVCVIKIDGRTIAEADYNLSEIQSKTEHSEYGYKLASYNAIRELEAYIRKLAGNDINIEYVCSL